MANGKKASREEVVESEGGEKGKGGREWQEMRFCFLLLPIMIHLYFCRKSVPHCLPSSQCFPDYAISTREARALSKGRLEFP